MVLSIIQYISKIQVSLSVCANLTTVKDRPHQNTHSIKNELITWLDNHTRSELEILHSRRFRWQDVQRHTKKFVNPLLSVSH